MRTWIKRLLTVVMSLLVTLLILEIAVRLFVDVTDYLEYESLPGVGLRLRPGQEGDLLADPVAGGPPVRGRFRVNGSGFNSPHDYREARYPGVYRLAIVGDSFVEALQVHYERAFPSVIEQRLRDQGVNAEVYSFGISGYGTAQVYRLLDREVLKYSPDFVVYLFVPNDVEDSTPWRGRTPSSQQFDLGDTGELVPLEITEYRLPLHRKLIKRSALFRYLFYQKHWAIRFRQLVMEEGWGHGDEPSAVRQDEDRAWAIVEALLVEIDQMLTRADVPWVLAWQADSDPDYFSDRLRRLSEIVARNHLPFLDLNAAFLQDYAKLHRPLVIQGDGHWSEEGHRVAGDAVASWLLADLHGKETDAHRP